MQPQYVYHTRSEGARTCEKVVSEEPRQLPWAATSSLSFLTLQSGQIMCCPLDVPWRSQTVLLRLLPWLFSFQLPRPGPGLCSLLHLLFLQPAKLCFWEELVHPSALCVRPTYAHALAKPLWELHILISAPAKPAKVMGLAGVELTKGIGRLSWGLGLSSVDV